MAKQFAQSVLITFLAVFLLFSYLERHWIPELPPIDAPISFSIDFVSGFYWPASERDPVLLIEGEVVWR